MAFQISWSAQAADDLKNIVHYIGLDNPDAAYALAKKIILHIEKAAKFPLSNRIVPEKNDESIREIMGLYLSVLYLPNFDDSNSQIEYDLETIPDIVKADKKLEVVLDRIFGKHNACRRFWNVYKDKELDAYTIADDLINIYHDLKTGLLEFCKQLAESHRKATMHWKTFFTMHWGYHLLGVMQPLHRIVYSDLDGSDDLEK